MSRPLLRSSAFARDLRGWLRFRPAATADIETALAQLAPDAAHPSPRSHKLRGRLAGCWACGAGYDVRVVYEVVPHEESEAILLLALGTHDEVC